MAQLRRLTYDRDVAQGSAVGAGRSTAIVLFTDLVGSTELRSRVGEDAAEEVRRNHDQLVADAIAANRGRLVKNLGDGVMATFSGASDALAAAVRIQQVLDLHNRASAGGTPLGARIGISAGDVTFEEADCFGTPVIEAARLCAAASGGQILVTEIVRLLAGSGSGQEFTPVGALELKGLPVPVPTAEVAWEALPISSIPLPALLTDVGRLFVGREQDLERLGQLWKEAAAGERRVALLAGEPGVGKTRLAAELAGRAYEEGATLLAGRCDEDLGVPYQPFVEALRHFVDHTPQEDLGKRLGRYGGELARLVPELTNVAPNLPPPLESDPETERYRLFDAVAAWLGAVSAEEPLLLVLDDLQWAAKPTLLLLRHVVRSPAQRVLIIGTYRDTELTHDHPLVKVVADLRRVGGFERISLSGLDDRGVTAIVEQASGQTLGEDGIALARAIYEETEGNPFFVGEVLRHLAETGALARQEGSWGTRLPVEELGIPEGVLDVVGRRLARLSADTHQALRVAAVAGTEFELGVLQAAGSLDEERLLSVLEEAADARLVIEVSATSYRFAHALVRATLYDSLTAARKVTLHRKVAQAIETVHEEALDDYLPALAHHWVRASAAAADTARAVEYATRAGDRALDQLAHDEAAAYYRQALELLDAAARPDGEARRCELLIALGESQRRAGDAAYRETLLDAARLARQQGDSDALARAALANSRSGSYSWTGVVDAERVAALDSALAQTAETDTATRARLLANLGVEIYWSADRDPAALSDMALHLARRLDDQATLAHVLQARVFATLRPELWAERRADTTELLGVADSLRDPAITWVAHYLRALSAMELGDIGEVDRCLDVAERLAVELGQPTPRYLTTLLRVGRVLLSGRIAEAESRLLEALALGESSGQPDARAYFRLQRFQIRFEQGRLDELESSLAKSVARNPELRELPLLGAMLAVVYAELDRDDQARLMLERLAASAPMRRYTRSQIVHVLTSMAMVAAHLRDRSWADVLYVALLPYADLIDSFGLPGWGAVVHHLALLAMLMDRFDEAEARFAAAEATHERIGAPTWLARTRLEWARMLLTRRLSGDAERARELLGQALTAARQLGLQNVERRAVELLSSQ
jgi:predicted ATPase/class 3 adenylate cyclase